MFIVVFIFCSTTLPSVSEPTTINTPENEGYILYSPEYTKTTMLIDQEKQIVHQWNSNHSQILANYLLENGSLLRSCYGTPYSLTWGGGFTGRVEMISWNGKLLWEYLRVNFTHCLHNDIEPLPNGNVLMIVWQRKPHHEVQEMGGNPELTKAGMFQTDYIIEVKPTYPKGGIIVWEWHVWDHLIQDYDPTKQHYGTIAHHPERIDINFRSKSRIGHYHHTDFSHINSIDYHEDLDQILISSRGFNEIWIIDHNTTPQEAAGPKGDLLYRWGNPQTYDAGNTNDQKLFAQHDAQWIPKKYPGEGHITIFNNGVHRPGIDFSSVDEINPPLTLKKDYERKQNKPFGPTDLSWTYGSEQSYFYSPYLSSAQRLPNGNMLICNGLFGTIFQVTSEKNLIWKYVNTNPFPLPVFNEIFKAEWYPPDYPGLDYLNEE